MTEPLRCGSKAARDGRSFGVTNVYDGETRHFRVLNLSTHRETLVAALAQQPNDIHLLAVKYILDTRDTYPTPFLIEGRVKDLLLPEALIPGTVVDSKPPRWLEAQVSLL